MADYSSSPNSECTQESFDKIWDTNWYLDFGYKNVDMPSHRYELKQFYEFYTKVVPNNFNDLRILEYGGGPTIYTMISACPRAKEIVSSDYMKSNLKAVELWQKKDPKGFDWKPFFEYVVTKLEGKGIEEVTRREEELRRKITALVPCDLRADNILDLPEEMAAYGPPYDVIASCFTVESVVETELEYVKAVNELAKMLGPGGYLILNGWTVCLDDHAVGSIDVPDNQNIDEVKSAFGLRVVSVEFVKESMSKAGLDIIQGEMSGPEDADFGSERYHFVVGRAPLQT